MSRFRDALPITDKEQLFVKKGRMSGQAYVHLNVIADDVVRGHRRTNKGFSFREELLPAVIRYLQSFASSPERTGKG